MHAPSKSPVEALKLAIEYSCVDSMARKPGELIQRMSESDREQLRNLKSDDAANMRNPLIYYRRPI